MLAMACMPGAGAQEDGAAPRAIKVEGRRNPGDVPYAGFVDLYNRLLTYLPAEPRMFDVLYRISFANLSLPEQDAYEAPSWAVSIVGDTIDEMVPVRRGGYFLLPERELARQEKATLMFKEKSRRNFVEVAWVLRIGTDQRLRYADFGKAMAQLRGVQKVIPVMRSLAYHAEKYGKFDGLKACFTGPGGAVLIDGAAAPATISGNCAVLPFEPVRAGSAEVIEFSGPLDIVTLIETAPYLRDKG
ncbi:MAG: hypothetical protein ACRYGO_04440 [Janthinobacterium lividum]